MVYVLSCILYPVGILYSPKGVKVNGIITVIIDGFHISNDLSFATHLIASEFSRPFTAEVAKMNKSTQMGSEIEVYIS